MLFMVKTNETLYRESIVAHYINIPETTETSITLARSDSPRVVTSTEVREAPDRPVCTAAPRPTSACSGIEE